MRNSLSLFNNPGFLQNNLWNEFDNYFKSIESSLPQTYTDMKLNTASELVETDKEYTFSMDLPGVKMDDVKISFEDSILTITGERKKETRADEAKYHIFEKSYGIFKKSFKMPKAIDVDHISAQMSEGILEITMPKSTQATTKQIEIKKKTI